MNSPPPKTECRITRILRLFHPPGAEDRVYRAGDRPGPGIFREVERGIIVRLPPAMPLPDLNSYAPSRFFRRTMEIPLSRRLFRPDGALDVTVLYLARQHVPAGTYRDIERGIDICLGSDGPLPDLQTGVPSGYRRVRGGEYRVRGKREREPEPKG